MSISTQSPLERTTMRRQSLGREGHIGYQTSENRSPLPGCPEQRQDLAPSLISDLETTCFGRCVVDQNWLDQLRIAQDSELEPAHVIDLDSCHDIQVNVASQQP